MCIAQSLVIPHKVDGTHTNIINKEFLNALRKRETMKGTQFKNSDTEPLFGIATINEKKRIVLGANIVSNKEFETEEECENYIASKPYELIINTAILAMKFTSENESNKKTRKNAKSNK